MSQSKRIPADIEAKILETYAAGYSKRETGAMFGYGRGGVDKVLKRYGVEPRSSGQALTGRVMSTEHRQRLSSNHHDVTGKHNPMFGKPPGHGKWAYVEHLDQWVRSSWEVTIATILHDLGIEHQYESQRLDFGGITYLPDFYTPSFDSYIEIKGWVNERWHRVEKELAKHPEIKLLLIDKHHYNEFVAKPEELAHALHSL